MRPRGSAADRWRRTHPCPACRSPTSPSIGASSSMMSWPYSPRIRIRPYGPGSPIRSDGLPRRSLAGGQVGQVGQVALPGVDDQHPGRAGGGEQLLQRRDDGGQLGDVVAEGLAEAAGQQEVALHVDHDQRHLAGRQRRTGWARRRPWARLPMGRRSCRMLLGVGHGTRRRGRCWVGRRAGADRERSARRRRGRCRPTAPGRAPSRWPGGRPRWCRPARRSRTGRAGCRSGCSGRAWCWWRSGRPAPRRR